MKIDTQGMSYGDGKGDGRTLEEQREYAIPPFNPPKLNIISDALKIELKDLINEVLDEREHEKKLNGPYDVYEDESDEAFTGGHTNAISWKRYTTYDTCV